MHKQALGLINSQFSNWCWRRAAEKHGDGARAQQKARHIDRLRTPAPQSVFILYEVGALMAASAADARMTMRRGPSCVILDELGCQRHVRFPPVSDQRWGNRPAQLVDS